MKTSPFLAMDPEEIYGQVRTHYSAASQSTNPKYGKAIAESFGYSLEELSKAPEGSNLGLSCGNPHAIAGIKEVGSTAEIPPVAM